MMASRASCLALIVAATAATAWTSPLADPALLARALVGTWALESREDRSRDGSRVAEPEIGPTPEGQLHYDASGHMGLQLMRKNRTPESIAGAKPRPGSGAVAGYDAYFGTYTLDAAAGTVSHHVIGALAPDSVGETFVRKVSVSGDELRLSFETSTAEGQPVVRTLVWKRLPR